MRNIPISSSISKCSETTESSHCIQLNMRRGGTNRYDGNGPFPSRRRMYNKLLLTLSLSCCYDVHKFSISGAFVTPSFSRTKCFRSSSTTAALSGALFGHASSTSSSGKGFGAVQEPPLAIEKEETLAEKVKELPTQEIKTRLLDLLPRMTGKAEEFRAIESYVNALEDKYVPVQTLGFLNLAMGGEWQLLFSTNRLGVPNTKLRLRQLVQKIDTNNKEGNLTNVALWDLAENSNAIFDASGTFSVQCSYEINQGARMLVEMNDHVLQLAQGSKVPTDVPGLVGMLHRAMPLELFDPNGSAIDTTYLDADLRIVRLTGSKFEGVRNIFIRTGSIEIDPTSSSK